MPERKSALRKPQPKDTGAKASVKVEKTKKLKDKAKKTKDPKDAKKGKTEKTKKETKEVKEDKVKSKKSKKEEVESTKPEKKAKKETKTIEKPTKTIEKPEPPAVPRRVSGKKAPEEASAGLITPPAKRNPCPSLDGVSTTTSSGGKSQVFENLEKWKQAAKNKSMTLEAYMDMVSQQELEEHLEQQMKEVADAEMKKDDTEEKDKPGKKEDESEKEEEESSSSSDESDSSESEDKPAEDQSQPAGVPTTEATGDDEEEDDCEGEEESEVEEDEMIQEFEDALNKLDGEANTKTEAKKDEGGEKAEKDQKEGVGQVVESQKTTGKFDTANSN